MKEREMNLKEFRTAIHRAYLPVKIFGVDYYLVYMVPGFEKSLIYKEIKSEQCFRDMIALFFWKFIDYYRFKFWVSLLFKKDKTTLMRWR